MTFFLFLLSNSDKKKMVDGKLKCMIGGDKKKEGEDGTKKGKESVERQRRRRGERGAIGMRGGAGGKKMGWGQERSGEIMYCRLINVKGAES